MTRFWVGLTILAVLLTAGLGVQKLLRSIHQPIAEALEQAAEASLQGDWDKALELSQQANARWEQFYHRTAAFADHNPMDELDGLFAELEIFAAEKEMPHYAALCSHLAKLSRSMAESHNISWWNLLSFPVPAQ